MENERIFRTNKVVLMILLGISVRLSAETYYVDATDGSDSNTGTSTSQAWQTLWKINAVTFFSGDTIRLKCGDSWNGQLWPKGSGSEGSPIIIDCYGDPNLGYPLINGQGIWGALKLHNQEYWEIRNLEITNYNPSDNDSLKAAVAIYLKDDASLPAGVNHLSHIYLDNLEVHNVNGKLDNYNNGGIYMSAGEGTTPTAFNKLWFEDVRITNCYIHDINTAGFINYSAWNNRTKYDNSLFAPWLNVIFRNNIFERCSGRALHMRSMLGAVAEYNIAYNNNYVDGEGEEANCFVMFNCENCIWQYNEIYNTAKFGGEPDGGAFDIDYRSKNNFCQYNYSHHNGMFCAAPCFGSTDTRFNINPIFRYNISQNETVEGVHLSGGTDGCKVYNNTFYFGSNTSNVKIIAHKSWNGYSTNTSYWNNIIINYGTNNSYDLGSSTNNEFDYNVFYGIHPPSEPADPHKLTSDPMLVNPGSGGTGLKSVYGYKLKSNSPCIDSGKTIPNNGGLDYWGNTVPYNSITDRGAHEYSGEGDGILIIKPEADSYVRDGDYSSSNYGSEVLLAVKDNSAANYNRKSYLRFDLSGLCGKVSSALLRLKLNSRNGISTNSVLFVNNDNWNESIINWNNKPDGQTILDSHPVEAEAGQWIEFDVTDQTNTEYIGDGKITFMIQETSLNKVYATYHSKEATFSDNYPQLTIIYKGDLTRDGKIDLNDFSFLGTGWKILYDTDFLKDFANNWLCGVN